MMRSAPLLSLTALTIALFLTSGTCFAQDHGAIDPQQVLAEFDIYKDGDCIIVPVEIAGKTYRFGVATGSSHTEFDTSFAGLLGAPIATSPSGPKWYLEANGKVGKANLQTGKPALLTDLYQLRGLSGHAIDGNLGMSFLSTQVIHVDFDRGKLYFLKSAGTQAGHSLPLHFDPMGIPVVDIDVPGVGKKWFVLNTGLVGGVNGALDRWTFDFLHAKGLMTRFVEVRPAFLNPADVLRGGEVQSMSLGPICLPPLFFGVNGRNELTLSFLRRFNVTFDFPGRRLYLTKSKDFSSPNRIDRSGLYLRREHGDTIVTLIYQGSPAQASGIRPGDVIVKLGGKNASEMRLGLLRLLLNTEGKTIPMTIRRGQQEIPVTLHLGAWPFERTIQTNRQDAKDAKAKGGEEKSATDEHR